MGRRFICFLFITAFAFADVTFNINSSPYTFPLFADRNKKISVTLVSYDKLKEARLNGFLLAKELPTESVLSFSPDGTATFFYFDTFLRHYRGRKQILTNKIEDLLSLPPSAAMPKCLRDIYSMKVSALSFNDWEDILWWTGELIYKFEFPFPVKSLNLSSPDGSLTTTIGDWEWEKVGRAVHIYASADGKNWILMWKSHPPGGVTQVKAELPPQLLGKKTIFLKFVGQNNNVLYDLYITAKLDAHQLMPLLFLKKGRNNFQFTYSSYGRCLLSFKGVSLIPTPRIYPKKLVVDVKDNNLTISFPIGASVQLEKEKHIIKGIRWLYIGNVLVLDNEFTSLPRLSIFKGKVEKIRDWKEYLRERAKKGDWVGKGDGKSEELEIKECTYKGWERRGSEVVIKTGIKVGDGKGELDWAFKPFAMNIGGHRYKGIGYAFIFKGLKIDGKLYELKIEERAKWESGDRLINQAWGDFREQNIDFLSPLEIAPAGYFAWSQPFLFFGGSKRVIVSIFDEVAYAKVGVNRELDNLVVLSSIPMRYGKTPFKCWLLAEGNFTDKWVLLNIWTDVFDYFGEKYRSLYGLKRVEPKPTLLWQGYDDAFEKYKKEGIPPLEKSWLWRFAEEKLPILEDLGIKVVYLAGGIWESDAEYPASKYLEGSKCFGSGCAPWHLEISKALGGDEALSYLCREAHKREIKIVLWSTPAHLSNSSPFLSRHPEWVAQEASGIPVTWYGDVVGVTLYGGYFPYAIGRYNAIRPLGVDGFWQDSFLTFGILTDFSQPTPYPQLERTIGMQRAMQRMGYEEIHIEGCGPFGLSSGGWGYGDPASFNKIKGKEYGLYYYVADSIFEKEAYYRALASKGILGIISLERLKDEDKKAISAYNRVYNHVAPFMKRRKLLGKGEEWLGVEWEDGRGNIVLFSFVSFPFKLPKGIRSVEDVTLQRSLKIKMKEFITQPYHTYLIKGLSLRTPKTGGE